MSVRIHARHLFSAMFFSVVALNWRAYAGEKPGILSTGYAPDKLRGILLSPATRHPFPKISERDARDRLPAALLLESDDDRQVRAVQKILQCPDRFLLQRATQPIVLTLMSVRQPEIAEDGRIILTDRLKAAPAAPPAIDYDRSFFEARAETIPIKNERLRSPGK